MTELEFCRICLDINVRMHQISGSEVQEVYEKLSNHKAQENGKLYSACYMCYSQLIKCRQLFIKSQKSDELLEQILAISNELNHKSIALFDRRTNGLQYPLMIAKLKNIQVPEYTEIMLIKLERQDDTDVDEVKDDMDDGSLPEEKLKLEIEQQERAMDCDKIENSEIRMNTQIENKLDSDIGTSDINEEKCFKCKFCGIKCDAKDVLIEHMRRHTATDMKSNQMYYIEIENNIGKSGLIESHNTCEKPLKCETTDCNSETINVFRKNTSSPTLEKPDQYKFSDYIYTMASDLKEHIKILRGERKFKCPHCSYACADKGIMQRHVRRHSGEKPFKCTYCSYTSPIKGNLKKHLRIHTGEKPFKCQYCDYKCTENCKLKNHMRTHTGEKPFTCPHCDYRCSSNECLTAHIRTHTAKKCFQCKLCSYKCATNSIFEKHMRTHTGEKPYICQFCTYTCSANGNLKRHLLTHTGEKPYKCQLCSYACVDNAKIKDHMRTHTGEKPFKCPHCDYTCAKKNNLKPHIRSHTGERPYKCSHCDLAFLDSGTLKKHVRIHTGEKPFKCQYCSYTCKASSALRKHTRTHTGEKPYVCEICGKKFSTGSYLRSHLHGHNVKCKKTDISLLSL